MARMYSRARGKAGSKKPTGSVNLSWVPYKAKEVEQLVIKLAKSEHTPSQIGAILRDAYGVPSVKAMTEKKMLKILKENNASPTLPEPIFSLIKRHIKLMKHLEVNKKDQTALHGEIITQSKIHKLAKYYKKKGVLPKTWAYDKTKAKLLAGT